MKTAPIHSTWKSWIWVPLLKACLLPLPSWQHPWCCVHMCTVSMCTWSVSASVKSQATTMVDPEINTLNSLHVWCWTHFDACTLRNLLYLPRFHDPYFQLHQYFCVQDPVRELAQLASLSCSQIDRKNISYYIILSLNLTEVSRIHYFNMAFMKF